MDATKSLRVWSTPPILIIHFKRTGNFGRKINTNIDFLLHNFDVSPFLVPRTYDPNAPDIDDEDEVETKEVEDGDIGNVEIQNGDSGHDPDDGDDGNLDKSDKEDGNEEEKGGDDQDTSESAKDKIPETVNVEWPRYPVPSSRKTVYNLFGAINHYGAAGGGHYIANCLCKDVSVKKANLVEEQKEDEMADMEDDDDEAVDSQMKWYLFDDHRVTAISPLDVKTKNAYLLFYIRSDIQELFVQHLVDKCNVKGADAADIEKLFDLEHIDRDKHFEFLPENVRELIGKELSSEEIKLLGSEGVETTAMHMKDCVIL